MKKVLLLLLGIGISVITSGCGSGLYLNNAYEFSRPNNEVKLAIIPAASDDGMLLDSVFTLIFSDSSRAQVLIEPGQIRRDLAQHSGLDPILNRLLAVEYSKDELKAGVNLRTALSDEEYAVLKDALGSPDIALLPVRMNMKNLGALTSGYSKIRLFDLRTGSLIYENSLDLNVEMGGDNGKIYLALGLIGFAADDYNNNFWRKFVQKP